MTPKDAEKVFAKKGEVELKTTYRSARCDSLCTPNILLHLIIETAHASSGIYIGSYTIQPTDPDGTWQLEYAFSRPGVYESIFGVQNVFCSVFKTALLDASRCRQEHVQ